MKNWIKTQLTTFPTKGLIFQVFKWTFMFHLIGLGLVNLYLGVVEHFGYFIAGTWQLWGAMIWWMFYDVIDGNNHVRKCYREIIRLQDEQIEQYHKAFLEIQRISKEEKKDGQVS